MDGFVSDHSAVTFQLGRILSSETFQRSNRSRAFLAYVVTETLSGRGDKLSERTVGRWALGRDGEFDGRYTAAVRVQANRLRRVLEVYYEGEGADDDVRIRMSPGSYVPQFIRTDRPARSRADDLRVAVFLSRGTSDSSPDAHARLVAEGLVLALAQFPTVAVIGPSRTAESNPRRIGLDLDVDFVVQVQLASSGSGRVIEVAVRDTESGCQVWHSDSKLDDPAIEVSELPEFALARRVAAALADDAGAWVKFFAEAGPPKRLLGPGHAEFDAQLAYFHYAETGSLDSLAEARSKLCRIVEQGPSSPSAKAMCGWTLVLGALFGIADDPARDVAVAEELSRRAQSDGLRTANPVAVLAGAALWRGLPDVARLHADQMIRLSPHHPAWLVVAGYLLALTDDWEEGLRIYRSGLALNPSFPSHLRALLALDRLIVGDDAAALVEASLGENAYFVHASVYRAMALAGLGHADEAQALWAGAREMEPLLADPEVWFTHHSPVPRSRLDALLSRYGPLLWLRNPPHIGEPPEPAVANL